MTTKTAEFAVKLDDQTSGAARSAATSLSDLKTKIDDDVKALREMQRAMREFKAAGESGSATAKGLKDEILAQRKSIAQSRQSWLELGGTFGKVDEQMAPLDLGVGELDKALVGASGPLGAMSSKLKSFGALLSNPIAAVVALAAAFAVLGVAIAAATAKLLQYGIAQSDARRSEALQIEGLNTLRQQFGMATASVAEYQAAIDRASDSTNVGRGTLQTYARQLSRAGLRGDALTEAVEAMGMAAMVQGDRGAARFRALALNARLTGGSVRDLAEQYRNRLGPIARRQMMSLDNQSARLRNSLDAIFRGLRIESFLAAVEEIQLLFSQSTASGRALKAIVEAMFQPLMDSVGELGPVVRRFFQGMVIAALVFARAVLRVRNFLRDTFGLDADLFGGVDALNLALGAGILVMTALVGVVGLVAAAFAAAALAVAAFVVPLLIVPAILVGLGIALGWAIGQLVEWFEETDFGALADSMIDGLVNGLRSGADRLVEAVRGLAGSASEAFRSALGIASPSRVFADFGMNITQGVSRGIDAGAPGVEDSVGGLVDVPTGGGVRSSAAISIGDVNINAAETSDPRELARAFRDELASVLEGVAVELGAPA